MEPFPEIVARYIQPINKMLFESISSFGPKTGLRDAIEYVLTVGKRYRPVIVCLVADALGKNWDVTDSILAVEYFHRASLIADDLPSMDDDDMRRDQPAVHKLYDEGTAILASYALFSAGFDRIRLNGQKLNQEALIPLAIENAAFNSGTFGAAGGQYLDLHPSVLNVEAYWDVADKKTGAFFQVAFVLGWLFGGGDPTQLELVKQAACHFGRTFQITDDFMDLHKDEGKLNLLAIVGREQATEFYLKELKGLKEKFKKLRLDSPELLALVAFIEQQFDQTVTVSSCS